MTQGGSTTHNHIHVTQIYWAILLVNGSLNELNFFGICPCGILVFSVVPWFFNPRSCVLMKVSLYDPIPVFSRQFICLVGSLYLTYNIVSRWLHPLSRPFSKCQYRMWEKWIDFSWTCQKDIFLFTFPVTFFAPHCEVRPVAWPANPSTFEVKHISLNSQVFEYKYCFNVLGCFRGLY